MQRYISIVRLQRNVALLALFNAQELCATIGPMAVASLAASGVKFSAGAIATTGAELLVDKDHGQKQDNRASLSPLSHPTWA